MENLGTIYNNKSIQLVVQKKGVTLQFENNQAQFIFDKPFLYECLAIVVNDHGYNKYNIFTAGHITKTNCIIERFNKNEVNGSDYVEITAIGF